MMQRILGLALFLTLLLLGSFPAQAQANAALPQWQHQNAISEPLGVARQLEIERETLEFDLSSILLKQASATVSATYELRNSGDTITTDLLFISPGILSSVVQLDGKPVAFQRLTRSQLAAQWTNAINRYATFETTPASGDPASDDKFLQFTITVPPGQHQLQVNYQAKPDIYNGWDVYRKYRVAYNLAPAQTWAKFGQLDLRVKLPSASEVEMLLFRDQPSGQSRSTGFPNVPGDRLTFLPEPNFWQRTSVQPEAVAQFFPDRTGEMLRARFLGLPADRLAIVVQPPAPTEALRRYNLLTSLGLFAGGGLSAISGWLLGRFTRQVTRWRRWAWALIPISLIAILPIAIVPLVLLFNLMDRLGRDGFNQQYLSALWHTPYSQIWLILLASVISLAGTFMLFLVGLLLPRKLARG